MAYLLASLLLQDPAWEASLRGRVSDPNGGAGDGLEYSDFFRTGYGASLQVSWMLDPAASSLGLWGSLGFDRFGGGGYRDDLGDRVSAEPLDRLLAMGGARVRFLFDESERRGHSLFLDLRFGGGAAVYDDVEGVFHVGGVTTKGVEIFDGGVQAAGEIATSFGVASRTFHFGFGPAYRWIGGPERGSGASSVVDPEVWGEFSFELGWEYRF